MTISQITAREIFDSNAKPTLEAFVHLSDGSVHSASVPSGTSVGANEAYELRDGGSRLEGMGVLKCVEIIEEVISPLLKNLDPVKQSELDNLMIDKDATPNKKKLGANTLLAVSTAVSRAGAHLKSDHLHQHLADLAQTRPKMPNLQILLIEGALHGGWATDIQEYMIMPGKSSVREDLETGIAIYKGLKKEIEYRKYSIGTGMEGAFSPNTLVDNTEAMRLIMASIEGQGWENSTDLKLAIDVAASSFYKNGKYSLPTDSTKILEKIEFTGVLHGWLENFPIASIEDPYAEDDWESFEEFTANVDGNLLVVGDDLLTSNALQIEKAARMKACNAVIIKPNQVGTVTETLDAIKKAQEVGFKVIISHRSGETCDSFIADLAVAVGAEYTKFGAPQHSERMAKYNRLLFLEGLLGEG